MNVVPDTSSPETAHLTHEQRFARRKEIAKRIVGGAEFHDICREFGVGLSTVRLACRENGVAVPRATSRRKSAQPLAG